MNLQLRNFYEVRFTDTSSAGMTPRKITKTLIVGGSACKVAFYRKFQDHETVRGGCIPSKNKFKTQEKNTKLRWLASDVNFKLQHTGCPTTHDLVPMLQ